MRISRRIGPAWMGAMVVAAVLAGCGGGGITTVGGRVTGLVTGTAVTLQINGKETLVIGSDGPFEFHDTLNADQNYDVVVIVQPARGHCTITNGSGNVDSNATKVTDIAVQCVPAYSVGGVISGLAANTSVTLKNGDDTTTFSANGVFSFPTQLPAGSGYDVSVTQQPSVRTCTVTQGSGTVQTTDVTNVIVTCA